MKECTEEKIIRENGFQNISFTLNEDRMLIPSGYKIMRGLEENGLARCIKITQNGKVRLVYMTGDSKPVSEIKQYMNYQAIMYILSEVIGIFQAVKNNGFLQCSCLSVESEDIYIDPRTLQTRMIYLPIISADEGNAESEARLREKLIGLISTVPQLTAQEVSTICEKLANWDISLNEIRTYAFASGNAENLEPIAEEMRHVGDETHTLAANIKLESLELNVSDSFHIHKDSFVIGKSKEHADGMIANSAVSRRHCRITFANGKYYIEDLDSTNGTMINNARIPSSQKKEITSGDIISIANVRFKAEF